MAPINPLPDWDPIVCGANEIWYQTNDNQALILEDNFGVNIIRHEFANGTGVITFDGGVTNIPEYMIRGDEDSYTYKDANLDRLTKIKLPKNLRTIEPMVFWRCRSLTEITIPDSVTEIGHNCFYQCSSLTSLNIPAGVTVLRSGLFNGCTSLRTMDIPNTVKAIEWYVFNDCTGMQKLTIPDSIETFNCWIAQNCTGELVVNSNIVCVPQYPSLVDFGYGSYNWEYNIREGGGVFEGSKFTKVTIGKSVTQVGRKAFCANTALQEVYFQGSLDVLNFATFCGCSSLRKIELPSGLREIQSYVFDGCQALQRLNIPNTVETLWAQIARDCGGELYIDRDVVATVSKSGYTGEYDESGNITGALDPGVFAGAKFTKVTFGSNVKKIATQAFLENRQLTSISFEGSVELIAYEAFRGCTSLGGELTLADVSTIGEKAFNECNFQKLTLQNISTIKEKAFDNCQALKEVVIDGVGYLGWEVFYTCNGLEKVTLANIESYDGGITFKQCNNIREVTISNIDIVNSSISGSSPKLEKATFKSIGTLKGYEDCKMLSDISLTDVKTIGNGCFERCSGLQNLTLSNIETIGDYAFKSCTGLLTLTLDNIQTIGEQAFASCTSLESVELDKINMTDWYVFQGCDKIESLSLGASVTWGERAFALMRGLKDVLIMGRDREHIPAYSFIGCTSLKRVSLETDEPPTLGEHCFPIGAAEVSATRLHPDFQIKVHDKPEYFHFWMRSGYMMSGFALIIVIPPKDEDEDEKDYDFRIQTLYFPFLVEEFTNEL